MLLLVLRTSKIYYFEKSAQMQRNLRPNDENRPNLRSAALASPVSAFRPATEVPESWAKQHHCRPRLFSRFAELGRSTERLMKLSTSKLQAGRFASARSLWGAASATSSTSSDREGAAQEKVSASALQSAQESAHASAQESAHASAHASAQRSAHASAHVSAHASAQRSAHVSAQATSARPSAQPIFA